MYINKQSNIQKRDLVSTKTASGNPVVITDCAGGKARSLKTTIEAIQDLHGYDHPWAGGAGKNLSPVENGNNIVLCAVESGVTYTFSLTTSDSVGFNLYKNNSEGELIINKTPITAGRTSVTFTADSNFNLYLNGLSLITGKSFAELTSLFMVEKGSTATSFAPYSNICPISGRTEARVDTENEDSSESAYAVIQLGQTVYGADINWDTGVATVLDAIADMGDLTWTYNGTSQVFNSSVLPGATTENVYTDAISSSYKEHQTGMSAMVNGDFRVLDGVMTVKDTAYTDATTFKAAVTGQTVCYKLATPTTLQLTPTQLQMLKGYNRVTIDNGSIEVEYVPNNLAGDIISLVEEELEEINTNIGLGETVSADMANCLPPRFKDISNDFFNGSLRSEIAAGNFRNVRPGDYIIGSSTGSKYVVGACDYWYNKGDTACTTHHLRLMLVEVKNISQLWAGLPYDGGTGHWAGLNRCPWNAAVNVDPTSASAVGSNSTNISRTITISGTGTASPTTASASGYAGSFIRDRLIARLLPDCFVADFGSANVLLCRNLNGNAVTTDKPSAAMSNWNGMTSGWTWMDSQIELPSEVELYGTMVFSSSAMDVGCQDQQLALFRNVSIEQVVGRTDVWTKAVASSADACLRASYGYASRSYASRAHYALPLANVK